MLFFLLFFFSTSLRSCAVFVVAVRDWHQRSEMRAPPCLHICSCSDRNDIRPSLLHLFITSTVNHYLSGTKIANQPEIWLNCLINEIDVLLQQACGTHTHTHTVRLLKWREMTSFFSVGACHVSCNWNVLGFCPVYLYWQRWRQLDRHIASYSALCWATMWENFAVKCQSYKMSRNTRHSQKQWHSLWYCLPWSTCV